MSLKLEGQTRR